MTEQSSSGARRTSTAKSRTDRSSAAERSSIAIIGAGNIGRALAKGWLNAKVRTPRSLVMTRRRTELLSDFAHGGVQVLADNRAAVERAGIVVLAVQPQQLEHVLDEIGEALDPDYHRLISLVSGAHIADLEDRVRAGVPIVRAMPNTGIAVGASMTCLAARDEAHSALEEATMLFDAVGETVAIPEELMTSATALCACGVAFFLRSIRAASQGGIEIGFHPHEALFLAAQTAKGAANLLLRDVGTHPEAEIDRVTTPRGCTIAGLNELEHRAFSSALIRAIVVSAEKAGALYADERGSDGG